MEVQDSFQMSPTAIISKNLGSHCDLPELTMANCLILHCNAGPALCGIFQLYGIYNVTSWSTSSLSYWMQCSPLLMLLLTHLLCQPSHPHIFFVNALSLISPLSTPPLSCLFCQHPLSYMLFANVTYLYTTVANTHIFYT